MASHNEFRNKDKYTQTPRQARTRKMGKFLEHLSSTGTVKVPVYIPHPVLNWRKFIDSKYGHQKEIFYDSMKKLGVADPKTFLIS